MILVTDLHYNRSNYLEVDKVLRYAFEQARLNKTSLVSLGDTHDTKALMRAECVSALIETCQSYPDVTFYILIGNHCLWNVKDDKRHSLEFLSTVPNVKLMSNQLTPAERIVNGIGFIPYKADLSEIDIELEYYKSIGVSTLFMHQGIRSAYQNAGRQDEDGYDPSKLEGFKVFVGHYHNPHYVGDNIYYIGSTLSHSFGEANQSKSLVNLHDSGIYDLIPSPAPRHVSYEITQDTSAPLPNHSENDFIRVVLKGPKYFIDSAIRDGVLSQYGSGIKVVKEYEKAGESIELNSKIPKEDIFKNFIERQALTVQQKEKLLTNVKEIINNHL